MLDPLVSVGIGFAVGGLGGALSSYLGWNASGEPWENRKFIAGLSTGVISGIGLVFANLAAFKTATDDFAVLALLGTVLFGALGIDMVREKVGTLVSNKPSTTVTSPAPS